MLTPRTVQSLSCGKEFVLFMTQSKFAPAFLWLSVSIDITEHGTRVSRFLLKAFSVFHQFTTLVCKFFIFVSLFRNRADCGVGGLKSMSLTRKHFHVVSRIKVVL